MMSSRYSPTSRRRPAQLSDGSRPTSVIAVVIVGALTYGGSALLNAPSLRAKAEALPLAATAARPVAVNLTKALDALAGGLQFERAGEAVDRLRHGTPAATTPTTVAGDGTGSDGTAGVGAGDGASGSGNGDGSTDTTVPDSSAASVPVRVPSPADKAVVYIAGDSQAKDFAPPLERLATATGVVTTQVFTKVATGLARPDVFNWNAQLTNDLARFKPDIVVVEFGGNDAQGLKLANGTAVQSPLDPLWAPEYSRRVGETMDLLLAAGRALIWVGVPNARLDSKTAELAVIRQIMQDQAANHPGVLFVDTWKLFESPQGRYADYIIDDDGQLKQVRQNDGFHLNVAGTERLARAIDRVLIGELKARGAAIG